MPIAVEVAKVSGALGCGRRFDYRRNASSAPKTEELKRSAEPTLKECLDNTEAYAKKTIKRLSAELGLPPEPTLMELLDDTAAWAKRERKKILAELKREKRAKGRL